MVGKLLNSRIFREALSHFSFLRFRNKFIPRQDGVYFFCDRRVQWSIWFLSTESNMETTEELHEIFSFSVILTQLPKSMLYHLFFEFSFLLGSSIKCSMELWQINFNCPPKNNTKMVLELSCTFPLFTKFYKANFFRTFV